jgi:hypothetical protein
MARSRLGAAFLALLPLACSGDGNADRNAAPGPASATTSTISLSAEAVRVGGSVVITVVPRDARGARVWRDQRVTLSIGENARVGRLSDVRFFAVDSSYRATLVATEPISRLTISASVGAVRLRTTRQLTVREAPAPQFTFCVTMGETCTFTGVREVRLVSEDGPVVTRTLSSPVLCLPGPQSRGFADAPAAVYARCEISEPRVTEIANPLRNGAGLDAATLIVPMGDPGSAEPLVRGESQTVGATGGEGSFRSSCHFATIGFFDPVAAPGISGAAPLSLFFGNAGVTSSSRPATLASSGAGTCVGGTVNRSAYWTPAVFDVRSSEVIPPDFMLVYHKSGFNMDPTLLRAFPAGLVIVAGNTRNVGAPQVVRQLPIAQWECEVTAWTITGAMPVCPVGDVVQLTISFPQCWNGTALDSPDHQSHMAYAVYRAPPARSSCPSTHPVALPSLTTIFRWPVTAGMDPSHWRLSTDTYPLTTRGGYSAHATWMNGWTPEFFSLVMSNCLQPGRDCGVNQLGDGRGLY